MDSLPLRLRNSGFGCHVIAQLLLFPGHEYGYSWYKYGCTTWPNVVSHTCLVSAWCSPLYAMSICPLLTLETAVSRISNWFLIEIKMLICMRHRYSKKREWDGLAHKPVLYHISPVHSPRLFVVLCVLLSIVNITFISWPTVSLNLVYGNRCVLKNSTTMMNGFYANDNENTLFDHNNVFSLIM